MKRKLAFAAWYCSPYTNSDYRYPNEGLAMREIDRLARAGWVTRRFEPAFEGWPSGDPAADTLRYNARIEAQVRRMPEQYWWIHKRFKGLSADDPDYYG